MYINTHTKEERAVRFGGWRSFQAGESGRLTGGGGFDAGP